MIISRSTKYFLMKNYILHRVINKLIIVFHFQFIWRRGGTEESEEPKYLIFNHRRIIQDERYYVVMADLNEFKMDLKIDSVKQEDEGKYICMYRRDKEKTIHERHIYLKMLGKHPVCLFP